MKVKVEDKICDGEKELVMVILNDQDKENIKNIHPDCTKYCVFPEEEHLIEEIKEWMKTD